MHIRSLALKNFRNYENLEIDFHRGINMIYGNNAQGKTNILEALFLAATTKSHKNAKDREMIRLGSDEAHIRVILEKKGSEQKIDMQLRKSRGKGIAVNGSRIKKSSELMGILNVVFFSPEDLNIIKNGPDVRRRFIDMELCQLDPVYFHDLSAYRKALVQRNKLLKQIYYDASLKGTLDIWDEKLVEYGKRIISARKKFNRNLTEFVEEISSELTGGKETIRSDYSPNTEEESYENDLKSARESDLRLFSTSRGPHRDDLLFYDNGTDLKKFGSQGQQRTGALSLKLAQIRLVKMITGDTPVLLLDDVMSELDRSRQNYLLDSIKDIQTIITCTGLEEFVNSNLTLDKIFYIENGTAQEQKINKDQDIEIFEQDTQKGL